MVLPELVTLEAYVADLENLIVVVPTNKIPALVTNALQILVTTFSLHLFSCHATMKSHRALYARLIQKMSLCPTASHSSGLVAPATPGLIFRSIGRIFTNPTSCVVIYLTLGGL